ncbi:MAG: hypothetical protein ACLR4E_09740 [Gemmiger formicilis]|uniref:hypothetical protein n=1 Tax=Gemmiger formicilis TaxID=745368 RepID=UPI003A17CF6A
MVRGLPLRPPQDGFSPLGRETALDPVEWTADGWPIINRRKGPSALQRYAPTCRGSQPHAASLDPPMRAAFGQPAPARRCRMGRLHAEPARRCARFDDKATKAGIYTARPPCNAASPHGWTQPCAPAGRRVSQAITTKNPIANSPRGTENGTLAELTVRSPEGKTVVRSAPAPAAPCTWRPTA